MKRRNCVLNIAGGIALSILTASAAFSAPADVGQMAPAFDAIDSSGKHRTLDEFKGKIVVLEWTSPACPFVRAQYAGGSMQGLQKWAVDKGAVWLSVLSTNPARSDYLDPAHAQTMSQNRKAVPTALLLDPTGQMGRAYDARNTPQMFVIAANGVIAYSGAIDSQATTDETVVPHSRNLVRAALDDLMANRKVATPHTAPYGCLVGYAS